MKKTTKYALGLCVAVCAMMVITNVDVLPSRPLAISLIPSAVRKTSTSSSHQEPELNALSSRDRKLLSGPTKEHKEKTRAPKRNRKQNEDILEEEISSSEPKADEGKSHAPVSSQRKRSQDNLETRNTATEEEKPVIMQAASGSVTPQRTGEDIVETRTPEMVRQANQPESSVRAVEEVPETATSSALELLKNLRHPVPAVGAEKSGSVEPAKKIQVGQFADWWPEAWQKSAVFKFQDQFVGDGPLFDACTSSPLKSTYPFVEPQKYLPSHISKNPCWYLVPRAKKGLRCVPYIYLSGVAKCGTSDIAKRLRMHPDVFEGTKKEYHWWERGRFGMYDEENPEKTVNVHGGQSFREYLQLITGKGLADLQKELRDNGTSVRIFGDYSPSYLWDPQNWYALDGNQGCPEPRIVVGHHIHHVYPQAKIVMTFRHPTPRLYSRFMSRIHRTPELKKATTTDFHRYVRDGIQVYKTCFLKKSIRQCAYNSSVYRESVVRLVEGMYPVFMADWLRIWPREQMFLMRYEDYGGHERERLQELMQFLGLKTLSKQEMDKMMEMDVVNSGSEEYQKYGDMKPETKKLLDDFYQPFVQQFAQMLNDERFLWKDVYQRQ